MCIENGDKKFHKSVCKDLIKKLESYAIKNCKKIGSRAVDPGNALDKDFNVYLVKFINNWGKAFGSIDGNKSQFSIVFENLTKANVDFEAKQDDYSLQEAIIPAASSSNSNISGLEAQVEEVILFATQMDPAMWRERETVQIVCNQVKECTNKINHQLDLSESNPNMDLTGLLNLNMKLGNLRECIALAIKGDPNAIKRMAQIGNPGANGILLLKLVNEEYKGPNQPKPQDRKQNQDYVKSKLESLTQYHDELTKKKTQLMEKVKKIETAMREKGQKIPVAGPNLKFGFDVCRISLNPKKSQQRNGSNVKPNVGPANPHVAPAYYVSLHHERILRPKSSQNYHKTMSQTSGSEFITISCNNFL